MTHHTFTLPNGLKVIAIRDKNYPVASVSVWIRAGSLYEDKSHHGYSHLLEHMLFAGTPTRTKKQIGQEVDSMGAYHNAFTRREGTSIHIDAVNNYLENMFELLADQVLNPKLNPNHLESEKRIVLEEIHRSEGNLQHEISLKTTKDLFGSHSLGMDIIGTPGSVQKATAAKIRRYYERLYSARNSLLVVSSQKTLSDIEKLAQKYFGSWRPGSRQRFTNLYPDLPSKRYFFHKQPTKQTHLSLNWIFPPALTFRDEATLELIEFYLGYGHFSPLKEELRHRLGLTYQVSVEYLSYAAANRFLISTSTSRPQEALRQIQKTIRQSLGQLKEAKVLSETKKRLRNVFIRTHSTPLSFIGSFGSYFLTSNKEYPPEKFLTLVKNITAADIIRVQKKYLSNKNLTLSIFGPKNIK